MDVRSPLNQCIALALAGILFLNPIVVAAAELAVDASAGGNTQLGQAGNGVPVINIATPNGSGLSHNKFREYNVGQQGLILNNATNKTQATQLGGLIIGNPNLQGRAASTILNEVTGGNRSRLAGYTEIAGQSARVIVANPHGITCNGCGFINTPRATLSTGNPVIESGRLDRFEVDGGDIAIEGAGLNASNIGEFELITRSAKLNAELHAQKLSIVAGRNDVQADSLAATARADDGSAKPELAIDSSALGGMYAGAIRLVGTEAGVGVKLAGDMAASGGDIQIDANGKLILAQAAASGDLRVNAQSAELIGKTYAGGTATLVTQGDLGNHQSLAARNDVRLSTGGQLSNRGVIEAGVNPDTSRNATGDLYASANDLRNSGSLVASRNLEANVSQVLGNQGGTLSAQGNARVSADKLDNRRGRMLTEGDLALSAVELDNQGGLVNGASQAQVQVGHLDNRGGELSSQTSVKLQAGSIDNRSGKVIGEQTLQLEVSGAVNNQGGSLGANQQLQVKATSLDNSQQGDVSSQGGLDVQVAGKLDNHGQGRIGANGAARVQAGSLDNRGGQFTSGSTLDLQAGLVDNGDAGRIASNGKLTASVAGLDQQGGGKLYSNSELDLDLNGGTLSNSGGLLNAPGQLLLKNLGDVSNQGGEISSQQAFTLAARSLDNSSGKLLSAQSLILRIDQTLKNLSGLISAAALDVRSASLDNGDGLLTGTGDLLLRVGSQVGNRSGEISSGGVTRLEAASLDNQGGDLLGDNGLVVSLSGVLDNQGGTLGAGRDLELQAASVDNRRGTLVADGALNARVSGQLDNQEQGNLLAKGPLAIQADRLDNRAGQVSGQGPVAIDANQLDNGSGRLAANDPLVLRANQLDNRQQGTISSKADLTYQGQRLDNQSGRITAAGPLSIEVEEVQNAQGRIASQGDLSATLGTLAQQAGELVAQGSLHLQARSLDNRQGGLVGSTKALTLEVGDIDNRGGELSSQADVSLAGQRLENSGGKLLAGNQLALVVDRLVNQAKGLIFGRHAITLDAHGLDNSGGILASGTSLAIALTPQSGGVEGELINRQGLISSEGALALQASRIDNQGGALSSAADLGLVSAGQLDNKRGSIVSDGNLAVASASLDNSEAGVLSAKGNAHVDTGALNNRQGGKLTTAGALDLDAGQVDNSANGRIAGGQSLTAKVTGLDQHDGGELFSKADLSLDLQQGLLNNSGGGLINSSGRLLLQNLGQVINQGGEISSQQGFTLAAGQLDNAGGKLLSNQALVLRIAQTLDNVKGTVSAKGLDLRAGSLDNREGLLSSRDLSTLVVTGHFDNQHGAVSASGQLDLTASTLDNRVGEIAGKADVQASIGTLDQRGGLLIAQGALSLKGQRLDNSDNGLVGAMQGLSLTIDEIDNRGGEISSQEAFQIFGEQLDNSDEGRLLAGTRLGVAVEHVINHAKGLISGKTGVDLTGRSLDNSGGRLLSQQAVAIDLGEVLTNQQGLINSEARLDLAAGSLENSGGSVSSAGAMDILSRGALSNDGGQLLTDSTLTLASESLSNLQGVLSAKGQAQLTTGRLDNSQGQLTSADALDLATGELINHGGRIGSQQVLTVSASGLAQQGGQLFSNASLSLDLQGGDLDNRQGLINAPGQLRLENLRKVDNQGGEISSQQSFMLAARSLDNTSGKLLGARALTLRVDQALANLKGLIAAARLDVAAASLANADGTLTSRSDTRVNISDALANDQQGLINAAQQLTVNAGSLDNRGGSLLAGSALNLRAQSIDNRDNGLINSQGDLGLQSGTLDSSQGGEVSAKGALSLLLDRMIQRQGRLIGDSGLTLDVNGGDLDNQGGLILAQGPLNLQRLRDLANQGGEISSSESFVLALRDFDNSGGRLISSGQLGLSGSQLRNQGGLISGWQGLSVSGQNLDNRNVGTLSSRDGNLSVTLSGALQNRGEGALVSQGSLALKAASLDNSNKGILSSGGDQQLDVATLLDNSAGGQIDSGAKLTLKATSLDNAAGTLQAQQALTLNAATLNNSAGNIAGNAALTLNLLGVFANANGKLASVGPLLLQGATQVDNQNGQIVSQGLLTLLTGGLDNSNRGTVAANDALLLTATGAVQNNNDGLIYSRDAGVRIQSASIDNGLGTVQANGDLETISGAFSNLGGRAISQVGNLDINADTLDNRGGTLASLQGWAKARLGGWLNNSLHADKGGVLQGQSLELTAASVANQGGHLSARSGNALLSVASLDNSQGVLFAKQMLKVNGNNLTNAGQIAAGTVDFSLAGALNNQAGIIESDSILTLAAASLDNRSGQLRALGTDGRTQLTVQGMLDNRNGTLETANLEFGLAAGSLQNVGGTLLHVGSGAFDIALPHVANAGGSIVTNGGLTLAADSWTNSSIIQAGRLTVNVGQFHQTASGQLLASNTFVGSGGNWSNDGLIASDGALSLNLNGSYSGSGRVTSLGELSMSATQLILPTAGRITSGGSTNVSVSGLFSNSGVMTSASDLMVNAGQLNNYGTLGSTEQLRLTTPTLLNENGLIFSGGDMALRVGSFTNRYADVYSLGSLDIAANDEGALSSLLENISATLESVGDMSLAAASIINRKDFFSVSERLVAGSITFHCYDCKGRHYDFDYFVNEEIERTVTADSAASAIAAGNNLNVSSSTFNNQHSLVSAAGNLTISTDVFNNEGAATESIIRSRTFRKTDDTEPSSVFYGFINGQLAEYNKYNSRFVHQYTKKIGVREPVEIILGTGDQVTSKPNPYFNPSFEHGIPDRFYSYILASSSETTINSGVAANAIVQAGGNVYINASSSLGNGVSRSNVAHAGGINRTSDTSVASGTGGTAIRINAQLPPDLAQQQVNPLTLPGFRIPSEPNGLFRLSGISASDVDATQADQGPKSWNMTGGSIDFAQRERDLTGTLAREAQIDERGPASIAIGQLGLGDRQLIDSTRIGAIRVETDGASTGAAAPERTGVTGNPSQGDAIASVPGGASNPPAQTVDHVQGLPATNGQSKSHKYLIETNPELTNLRQFLSSDYMLGNLGYDPDHTQKRLGDGLYEQRLVREAIAARTGQRFLDGLTSDEAMFRYLMDNAIASKQQLGLSVGVSLSAAQVAALTHDIVWMEVHVVNGEKVLVPVLYLAQADGRLAPSGALIQGKDVAMISGGELSNQGTLRASNNLSATGGNIANSGLIEAGNRLDLLATDSIRNAQGGIIAGRDVSAIALTGDIINERSQGSLRNVGPTTRQDSVMDNAARIEAGNNLSLSAGRDLVNIGSVLSAGGNASLSAGRDLLIASATEVDTAEGRAKKSRWTEIDITQHASELQVDGDLEIEAGRDLAVIASRLGAGGDIDLAAGRDLDIGSAANESHYEYHYKGGGKKLDIQKDQVRQQGSEITAGGDLSVISGNDLSITASRLEAGDEAYLYAGNDLSLLAAEDSDYSLYDMKKKGSFGSKKTQRDEVTDVRNVGSSIIAGGDLTLVSEGGQRYQKATLDSGADLTLDSGGEIAFEAVKDLHQESHEKSKGDLAWVSAKGKGTTDETVRQSELVAQGEIAIKAVDGLKLDLKHIDQKTVSQTIDAMVQADSSLAWIKEMEQRGDVDWQRVKEIHDSFKYSHSGLGAGAQLAIAILVTYLTWGAASAAVGTSAGATAGSGTAMAAAGTNALGVSVAAGWGNVAATSVITSVATTGATSAINNKGDPGAALKDTLSHDSLKNYVVAGVSGGVADGGIGLEIAVNSAMKTVLQGGKFKDNLTQAAIDLAANALTAAIYVKVGDGLLGTGLPTKVAVHALVGGLIGEAAGGDFRTAALAAGANEALIDTFGKDLFPGEAHERVLAMTSQLIGITVAAAAGGDEKAQEKAGWVAQQATVNNYLKHEEVGELAKELTGCRAAVDPSACRSQVKDKYQELSDAKTGVGLYGCKEGGEAACNAQLKEVKDGSTTFDSVLGLLALTDDERAIVGHFQDINHADERVAYDPWKQTFWQESGAAGGILLSGAAALAAAKEAAAAKELALGVQKAPALDFGRIEDTFSAIKPGPLANNIAETFSGGRYSVISLEKDTVLYRAGTADKPLGQFFSSEPPLGIVQTRIDKAVLPEWSGGAKSSIDTSFAIEIPAGTKVYIGEVGVQGGFYVGGTQQIVVQKPWLIEGVKVINSSPLK
ncbi:filamentous hemagglutinin N-terminal domain-containing protein [Pseudomonas sp. BN411]|uniref:two-partner secretion domain-containing protein n=1 Tax=Pseudomonas sp. BN411 TaxID=2567887 RepID=UPI002455B93D|nr:filamentous hemagglutinin N-terminal domain-containing protein [Pseudomonas sp. BN411]MDH4563185.1 filamentous hemagglutinin N-terminal domain-containing protein [Pseudomonas sp. BN411]